MLYKCNIPGTLAEVETDPADVLNEVWRDIQLFVQAFVVFSTFMGAQASSQLLGP